MTDLMPDGEVIARQWLLDDPEISALIGTSAATTLPKEWSEPFVVVELVQTIRMSGEAFLAESWLQVDVYADKNNFRLASQVGRTIQAVGDDWSGTVIPSQGESAYVYGMRVQNMRRIPEPDTEWARYMLDVVFMMRREQ